MSERLPKPIRDRLATERAHQPYWNDVLGAEYCHADGEEWPCLHYRQTRPAKCKCSHVRHAGQCWSTACGCREYRPDNRPPKTDGGPSLREYLESKGEL
jgi:hypothetical protein